MLIGVILEIDEVVLSVLAGALCCNKVKRFPWSGMNHAGIMEGRRTGRGEEEGRREEEEEQEGRWGGGGKRGWRCGGEGGWGGGYSHESWSLSMEGRVSLCYRLHMEHRSLRGFLCFPAAERRLILFLSIWCVRRMGIVFS